jgi:hypothetical protein
LEHSNDNEPARLSVCPNRAAVCGLCIPFRRDDPSTPAKWFFYEAKSKGHPTFNALPLCQRHAILMWASCWANGSTVLVKGKLTALPDVFTFDGYSDFEVIDNA